MKKKKIENLKKNWEKLMEKRGGFAVNMDESAGRKGPRSFISHLNDGHLRAASVSKQKPSFSNGDDPPPSFNSQQWPPRNYQATTTSTPSIQTSPYRKINNQAKSTDINEIDD